MASDVAHAAALIGAEWSAFIDLLDDDRTSWDGPTRLAGWRVEDLARHAHWGVTLETEGLVLATSGEAGRAAGRHIEGPREDVVAALRSARSAFVEALAAAPDDPTRPVPMPYGDVPLALALEIFVMEAALHRSDLTQAVTGEVVLLADAAPACAAVLRTYWAAWAMSATTPPEAGTAIRLQGETVRVEVEFDGAAWGPPVGKPSVVVSGADAAVLLYAYGRVSLDDAGLTVTGDRELAGRLKELVPGP